MDTFRPRILIIDDEPAICRTLAALLRGEGYECETESDPSAAWMRLRDKTFHIVLTDLVMPEMDGLDLVRHLRREKQVAEVIVMTAYTSLERAVDAYGLGVADYLMKPFDSLGEVLAVVRRAEDRLRRWREVMVNSMGQTSSVAGPDTHSAQPARQRDRDPVNTAVLQQQHAELLTLVESLDHRLDHEFTPHHAGEVSKLLGSLSDELEAHLACEDRMLYPILKKNRDPRVVRTAREFEASMGGLHDTFAGYLGMWIPDRMMEDPTKFVTATLGVLAALRERIEKENRVLFPLYTGAEPG